MTTAQQIAALIVIIIGFAYAVVLARRMHT